MQTAKEDGVSPRPPGMNIEVVESVAVGPPGLVDAHDVASPSGTSRQRRSVFAWLRYVFARYWVLELSVFLILAIAYNVVRAVSHVGDLDPYANARFILSGEGPIFDILERSLNQWLNTVPVLAIVSCYIYAVFHYAATPVVFFLSRYRGGWQYWRGYWALIIGSGLALVIYALYPVAPPRLMPDLGIIDVMREYASYGWWGSAASAPRGIGDATNQFAAMPSMHFGWALWCAIQMWGFRTRIFRVIAVVYPAVLAVVVFATGNHFLLDIVGGALCILVGYGVVELIGRRQREPVETSAVT